VTFPNKLNVRSGPGTKFRTITQVPKAGTYKVDLLRTIKCWIKIRYRISDGRKNAGWVSARHSTFEYDNHMSKPTNTLTQSLSARGVYRLVANSTYKIVTPSGTGTAVAISPTVLLTNCHVLGRYNEVHIIENGRYLSYLIHDDKSKDKCFIRSLFFEVKPVPNVTSYNRIQKGERAISIGAPHGINRSLGKGVVFNLPKGNDGSRWIAATAPVDHGSSGGGLFDTKGNLLGITTLLVKIDRGSSFGLSIAADDFWQ